MPFWSNAFGDFAGAELPPDAQRADRPGGGPIRDGAAADGRGATPLPRHHRRQGAGGVGRVARHRFVPAEVRRQAYKDHPVPIGLDQTISQPYIVALMTQLVRPAPESRALDVGVGSGYQAAILAELCRQVYGVEILEPLAEAARAAAGRTGLPERRHPLGRRLPGLARIRPLRRDYRRRRAGPRAAAAGGAACPRRPTGDPGGPLLAGTSADREAVGRQSAPHVHCAGAVRADDRRGGRATTVAGTRSYQRQPL